MAHFQTAVLAVLTILCSSMEETHSKTIRGPIRRALEGTGTPDGIPPAFEHVCDPYLDTPGFGPCNAYCEAKDCDTILVHNNPSCDKVKAAFIEATGETTMPCDDDDGDGVQNIDDNCPNDAAKIEPGLCGCGEFDQDTDGDGTEDCNDNCPNDAAKIEPGVCGCGESDVFCNINQWYCNGSCGNWDGVNGCGQGDADEFCKLKTGNPLSVATSYAITGGIVTSPMVCCPPPTVPIPYSGCTDTGITTSLGVQVQMGMDSNGSGSVITNLICS